VRSEGDEVQFTGNMVDLSKLEGGYSVTLHTNFRPTAVGQPLFGSILGAGNRTNSSDAIS